MEILPKFLAENNILHGIVAHILQSLMDGYQSSSEFCVHLEIYFVVEPCDLVFYYSSPTVSISNYAYWHLRQFSKLQTFP
jgi:hypothetical protein